MCTIHRFQSQLGDVSITRVYGVVQQCRSRILRNQPSSESQGVGRKGPNVIDIVLTFKGGGLTYFNNLV